MILVKKLQKYINKYRYFPGEEILPSDQSRAKEQAKFTYSPLRQAFEKTNKSNQKPRGKQIKTTEEHGKQLVESNILNKTMIMILKRIAHHF